VAGCATAAGAAEIDMVVNVGKVLGGDWEFVRGRSGGSTRRWRNSRKMERSIDRPINDSGLKAGVFIAK
jgi:hypothetical protein